MSVRKTSITVFTMLLLLLPAAFLGMHGAEDVGAAPLAQASPTVEPCGPDSGTPCTETQPPDAGGDQPWHEAVNLSQSGAASTFSAVIDQSGAMHVVWQETEGDLFTYVQGSAAEWTSPLATELPFGTPDFYPDLDEDDPVPLFSPELVATTDGRIHAFWIDDTALLQYSSVVAEEFGDFSAWEDREELGEGILALDAVSDPSGQLHVVYVSSVHTPESPSGVYYRRLVAGEDWSEPTPLYSSLYLRTITPEQANVQITSANGGASIQVVWDNILLEKVFHALSADNGQSWSAATEIDGREPEDDSANNGPSQITIGASGNNVVLVWQAGHDGVVCGQYYQVSSDAGNSWGPRTLFESPTGCSENKQLIAGANTPIFLLTSNPDSTYLLVWNGERWGEAIPQEPLVNFTNPATNQLVQFGCHQAHLTGNQQLVVFGCNEGGVADIWYTTRSVESVEEWFPPESVWSNPAVAVSSAAEKQALDLLADADGRLHLFWTENQSDPIYYSFWNGSWSQSLPALTSSEGTARQPSVTLSPTGRLLAVWSDPVSGTIYFSESDPTELGTSGSWSSPVSLVQPSSLAISPEIVTAPDGTIHVVFAIPFNEERGLYWTRSADAGQTWATPSLVYDGRVDEQASVGDPKLVVTDNGALHLLWQLHSLLQEEGLGTVLYMRSDDEGETWTPVQTAVDGPITWSAIVSGSGQRLYRIWQQKNESAFSLQFQSSQDNGNSWSQTGILASVTEDVAPAAVTVDPSGNIHLLQVTSRALQHWITNADGWALAEELDMNESSLPDSGSLAVSIDEDNRLVAAYIVSAMSSTEETTTVQYEIQVTDRLLDNAAESAEPVIVGTPTPAASESITTTLPITTPTPTPSPTPTLVFPTEFESEGNVLPFLNTANRWVRLGVALVPALFIILVVVVLRSTAIFNRRK